MNEQEKKALKEKLYKDIKKAEADMVEYELKLANTKAAIQLGIINK